MNLKTLTPIINMDTFRRMKQIMSKLVGDREALAIAAVRAIDANYRRLSLPSSIQKARKFVFGPRSANANSHTLSKRTDIYWRVIDPVNCKQLTH